MLGLGLDLVLSDARKTLTDLRFVGHSLVWGFVLCPALAFLMVAVIPMPAPYGIGLMLLGLAPCAPFVPMAARVSGGDLGYVAGLMVLSSVCVVFYMPLMVPVLVHGFSADTWTIAKPLVFFVAIPLVVGVIVRLLSPRGADHARPVVKAITSIDTGLMLLLIFWLYGRDFISSVGSYAIGSQVLFYALVTAAAYGFARRLPEEQRTVLAIGIATRNIGAALAPLLSVAGTDRRAIAMCVLAIPLTGAVAFAAAAIFGRAARAV
nr:bile acid:sodium symporter [Roseomonas rosulenta]